MPRSYMFGARRYFGGRLVRFQTEGYESGYAGTWGVLAAPTVLRGVRIPAQTFLVRDTDHDCYVVNVVAPLAVYGHPLTRGSVIEFADNPFLGSWLFGLLAIGQASQEGVGGALLLLLRTIVGFVLAPILIPFCSWYYTRWTKVMVPAPTQIGALLATPERPIEISWSGAVRYFEDPATAATSRTEEQP